MEDRQVYIEPLITPQIKCYLRILLQTYLKLKTLSDYEYSDHRDV